MSAEFNPPLTNSSESKPVVNAPAMPMDRDTFLRMAIGQGVSDIHLRVGMPPLFRKDGVLQPTKLPIQSEGELLAFLQHVLPTTNLERLKEGRDFDFSFSLDTSARFRVNVFYEMNQLGLVLRVIPMRIPSLADLGIPSVVQRFCDLHKGLVLITGPTGCGKSTTLAALLNVINLNSQKHIVTLEDPIEFVYQNQLSLFTQRQLGTDTDSFPNGVRAALRQDPNVLLIGEMRDRETLIAALHAAETGHLVFSTLHTTDSVQTINRIINAFEPHERESIRHQLADVLQGTVSQRLVRKKDGKGRLAVCEVMMMTSTVRDYILRNEVDQIYDLLKQGTSDGMVDLNQSLYRAYQHSWIDEKTAMQTSENPGEMHQLMRGVYHGTHQSY